MGFESDANLNHMFNWTIFLSRNATIHKKFVHIFKKNEFEVSSQLDERMLFENKSMDFCWLVSNCGKTFSQKRFQIADSLIPLLPSKIHIWGKAIRNGCLKGGHPNIVDHGATYGAGISYYDIPQSYIKGCKFYFAFGNSNCSDYVTEKFLNAIEVGAIPIVVGWWDTYRELLPGSFIHVSEFANVSQLAEHLKGLLKDEMRLKKYHEWRKVYRYERAGVKASCEFCQKLRKLKLSQIAGEQPNPSIIPNMAKEFKTLQKCTS